MPTLAAVREQTSPRTGSSGVPWRPSRTADRARPSSRQAPRLWPARRRLVPESTTSLPVPSTMQTHHPTSLRVVPWTGSAGARGFRSLCLTSRDHDESVRPQRRAVFSFHDRQMPVARGNQSVPATAQRHNRPVADAIATDAAGEWSPVEVSGLVFWGHGAPRSPEFQDRRRRTAHARDRHP